MGTLLRACFGGLRRVVRAPATVVGVYLVTLAVSMPVGLGFYDSLARQSGGVPPPRGAEKPLDLDWVDEVTGGNTGLVSTLTPAVIGVAAPLDNLGALADAQPRPMAVVVVAAVYGVVWLFLWGGVIERLATDHVMGWRGFWTAARTRFPALLRLGGMALAAYVVLYVTLHAFLFGPVYAWMAGAVALERTAFAWRVAFYALFGAAVLTVMVMADFARIILVLSDRLRVADAIVEAARFVRRHLFPVAGLVVVNGLLFAALLIGYGGSEFLSSGSTVRTGRLIVVGQAYIGARLVLRLLLTASQVRLFQLAAPAGIEEAR